MKKVQFCKISSRIKRATYVQSICTIKIEDKKFISNVFFGTRNIYVKVNNTMGFRICSYLTKRGVKKIFKIQSVLNSYDLAPKPYFFELCFVKFCIPRVSKAVKSEKLKVYSIFQEHINVTRLYNHFKEKFTEPFVAFRKKIYEVAKNNGFRACDLKKGNILVSENGPKCIDFDDWKITDHLLFNKIPINNKKNISI